MVVLTTTPANGSLLGVRVCVCVYVYVREREREREREPEAERNRVAMAVGGQGLAPTITAMPFMCVHGAGEERSSDHRARAAISLFYYCCCA